MLLKKRFMFFVVFALLICVGQAAAGSNANAVVSLDLIADGGAGNQIDDGVVSGVVSGQGSKIIVEVFAKGVVTSLIGIGVKFDFDSSVLVLDADIGDRGVFGFLSTASSYEPKTATFGNITPVTLPTSGYVGRVEFSTVIDVTGKEFSLGIESIHIGVSQVDQDYLTSASKIEFNRDKQITAADADFDGSGVVDIADFLQFVNAYGTANAKYDLDGSGTVDIADFLAFVDLYGQTVQTVSVDGVDSVEGDRAALIALYNATDGANWTDNTNWLSDKPLREWHGVFTNGQGRVRELVLRSNQLAGPIPPELGNLANLEWLWLYDNQLAGVIPPELGNLSQLRTMELDRNQLAGAIPPELGNLANLESLGLGDNQLAGPIPPELGNLANLKYLASAANQLSGPIPPELGNLTNLEILRLYKNQLSGPIPPELGNLSQLRTVELWINQLSGAIPPELGKLSNLTNLDLNKNNLSGAIPGELANLANLTRVALSSNPNLCMPSALKDWKYYNTKGVAKCSE